MKKSCFVIGTYVACLLTGLKSLAQNNNDSIPQVEESAEVFLGDYTDRFQELFFDGLRQKSIENYDRAINLFLEAKQLQPNSNVINHELGKVYALDKSFVKAQELILEALTNEPENYWYLYSLVELLNAQNTNLDGIDHNLNLDNEKIRKNLALAYYNLSSYTLAKEQLEKLTNSDFKNNLAVKIDDALSRRQDNVQKTFSSTVVRQQANPVSSIQFNLEQQIKMENYGIVALRAASALESYPLQPYFYYAYGLALHKKDKNYQAIEVLEGGLDYLFDDIKLANKFYNTLAAAYTAMHNPTKANYYRNKIRPGF